MIEIDTFFYTCEQIKSMCPDVKPEKKNLENKDSDDQKDDATLLDGKTLHDLYRHTAKLIK